MSRKRQRQQLADSLGRSAKHFNKREVERLIKLFDTLVAESSSRFAAAGFDRNMFRDTLHSAFGMTDDMIMDRVFRTFDRDNDSCISVVEWVEGLSVFLRGTLEERIKYCFEVYDLNGDGYISREEMFQMLKNSLLKQPSEEDPDEGIKDLVDIALKKMDYDHDGKLSFMDFEKAVRDENLLLEAFGPCLPDIKLTYVVGWRTRKGLVAMIAGCITSHQLESSCFQNARLLLTGSQKTFKGLGKSRAVWHLNRKLSRKLINCNSQQNTVSETRYKYHTGVSRTTCKVAVPRGKQV